MKTSELQGKTVGELMANINLVPDIKGVYFIVKPSGFQPKFLAEGTGGHFKGRNPNVTLDELRANWIEDEEILYIGKAGGGSTNATLRKRLRQYMQFGEGKPIGHWGGRYIWQLADSRNLIVKWLPLPDSDPILVESQLIQDFRNTHQGRRPFANLRD